ncbi:MAG TPA: hypothetical protein VFJ58_19105, partial [Armatimonadota bacterium]|nr:hypothetical protein [Armatimonadota bacterium]
ADLLIRIGNARTDAGDLAGASEALEECLALNRELEAPEDVLHTVQSLARCRSLMGRTDEAETLFREVAASTNPAIAWRGLLGLGQIMEQRDLYEEALSEYERAREAVERLPASQDASRRIAEIYVRTNLGNVYMAEGDFVSALPLWQENLDACEDRALPDQFLEALLSESVCHLHLGRPGAAFDLCRRAIRLCRLLGDRERLAVGRACLSEMMAAAGLGEEGREQAREAAKLSSEISTSRGVSWANLALAHNLMLLDLEEQARYCLDTEIGSPYPKNRAVALLHRSELSRRGGDTISAETDAREALNSLNERGALHLEKAAWSTLARAGAARGDAALIDESLQHAAALDRQTPGLPDTPWMIEAAHGDLSRLRGNLAEAAGRYRAAVRILQALRSDLSAHGVIEASLDDPEKLRVYEEAIRASRDAGEPEAADAILTEAAWPPLTDASGTE